MAQDPLFCNVKDLIFPDYSKNPNMGFVIGPEPFSGWPVESEESFTLMRAREVRHLPNDDYLSRLRSGSLDMGTRKEAVDWIFKVHSHFCFGPLSFSLAINYFDRFVSTVNLPALSEKPWAVQLLAVTCLSIAIKMAETTVTLTESLQVCEPKFVFEAKTIQKMELLVLNSLNWQMQACTPFAFLDYFLRKINVDILASSLALVSRSIELILNTVKEIDFLEFRPCEIAAAAAIAVSVEATPDKAMTSFDQLEKERVLRCLRLVIDMNLVPGGASATSSTFLQTPSGVLDAGSSLTNTRSPDDPSPSKKPKLDKDANFQSNR